MHQIHVHLSYTGASIVSDEMYVGQQTYLSEFKRNFNQKKYEEERPIITRMALHANSITFVHPKSDKEVSVEAPYPKDFDVLVKQLRKFS